MIFDKTATTGTGFLDAKQCFLNILKEEERDAFTVDFIELWILFSSLGGSLFVHHTTS